MENIYTYAVRNGKINMDALCAMINNMDPEMRERFCSAILGLVDYAPEIPAQTIKDGKEYHLSGYNFLKDEVYFTYDETITRYFADQKYADRYAASGNYSYEGVREADETHTIPATYTRVCESSCSLNDWCATAN